MKITTIEMRNLTIWYRRHHAFISLVELVVFLYCFIFSRLCDRCLFALVKEEDKTVRAGDAASLALYFRWLKRINSHLRNITTSVVNPFDRIGFEPRRTKS